jgi:hypothetical protein
MGTLVLAQLGLGISPAQRTIQGVRADLGILVRSFSQHGLVCLFLSVLFLDVGRTLSW